jgi:hypothetical protein
MLKPRLLCLPRFPLLVLGGLAYRDLEIVTELSVSYGLVGLLRPLTVYPSEMVYWFVSLLRCFLPSGAYTWDSRIYQQYRSFKVGKLILEIPQWLTHKLALHFDTAANGKRVKLFWTAFAGMFAYEVLPAYMFPLLNGVNIFCLASQHASQKVVDGFTNLFGGADGNEGLGLLSLSFDWQYIGST